MRIDRLEVLAADGGFTTFHFLKVTTDQGLVGWSEFGDGFPSPGGLTPLVLHLGERVVGKDPRLVRRLTVDLYSATRAAGGGLYAQAIAAIENACLDIAAKALGVGVCDLFGGPLRHRIPIYWSHCGMIRVRRPSFIGEQVPLLRSLADIEALGAEVAARGFQGLKTNIIRFDVDGPRMHRAGFAPVGAGPALNADPALVAAAVDMIAAFRRGAGSALDISLDLNFHCRADGVLRLARALEPYGIAWLEADLHDPGTLATIRRSSSVPIGSLETIYNKRAMMPFLEQRAVDLAIVDVMWNGFTESLAMASAAEAFEVSCAPHVYAGPLSSAMSAHFAALLPNLRVMEQDIDVSPWHDTFITSPRDIRQGEYVLPSGPGWGCEVNEEAVRAHPVVSGA